MRIFHEDKISLIITMLILFLFVVSTLLFSQTNDFLISGEDNSPSTIIQNSPKLHPFNSGKFLTTWKDYRHGEVTTYAQWFDSLRNKIGSNFKIYDDDRVVFNSNGTFITVDEYYSYSYDLPTHNIYARTFKDNQAISNIFQVFFAWGYGGDTDPLGRQFLTVAADNRFIFFFNDEGYLRLKSFDANGQYFSEENLINKIPFRASAHAGGADYEGNCLLVSFIARKYNYNGGEDDSIPVGIYINIFDRNDSLRVQNLLLKEFNAISENYYDRNSSPLLQCILLSDSTWQIFWFDKDAKQLSFITVNSKGEIIKGIQSINFPQHIPLNIINSFSISQIQKDKFAVFISTEWPNSWWSSYFHALITFTGKGEFLDMHQLNVGAYSPIPYAVNNIFLASDTTFFASSENNEDVYLNTINATFKTLSSQKMNNDLTGGNEHSPSVTVIDENRYFVSWTNETGTFGIEVDKNGNISQSKKGFEAGRFFFFPNGNCYNLWTRDTLIGDILFSHQGYTVFNNNWEVLQRDTLERYNYGGSQNPDILRLNDTTFVMYYTRNTNGILILLDKEGYQIKTTSVNLDVGGELKLFSANETKFLLSRSNKNQYFNEHLEPVSEVFILHYDLYIGNNKFLLLDKYSSDSRIFALIIDSSGNQYNRFQLVDNYYSYYNKFDVIRLPGSGFAYLFYTADKIYTASFTSEGKAISKPFLIHDNTALPGMDASLVFKNQAFFAWNDARNPDKGFDIYGRIINAGKLTPVEEEVINTPARYQLFQNYPNPFNPATTITYSIPENSKVELRVFDMLGKEVLTLVNEEKSAGEHKVTFNASHFVSGVYIYNLTAGAFTQTRKMILLK